MIASWWLLFRSSSLRWTVPLASCLCLLLTGGDLRVSASSMEASSESALMILVWAPAVLLMAYASVRSSGLHRDDDVLVLPLSRACRTRRSASVLGSQLTWVALGWIGYWVGCSVLAERGRTPLYWSVALNGITVTALASAIGALLAIQRRPAWWAALASGAAYLGLAVWFYVPTAPGSALYSPYAPLFFIEALPSSSLLVLQLAWGLAAALTLAVWAARTIGSGTALVIILACALATTGASVSVPEIRARSGTIPLICKPHQTANVCLWADHEGTRRRIAAEVDVAIALLGESFRAHYVSEGDLDGRPAALPRQASAADTILIPVSANPAPRDAAARIVAATLRPPPRCANLTSASEFGEPVGAAVERLVVDRRTAPGSARLDDHQLALRLGPIGRDIARCRRPVLR